MLQYLIWKLEACTSKRGVHVYKGKHNVHVCTPTEKLQGIVIFFMELWKNL